MSELDCWDFDQFATQRRASRDLWVIIKGSFENLLSRNARRNIRKTPLATVHYIYSRNLRISSHSIALLIYIKGVSPPGAPADMGPSASHAST